MPENVVNFKPDTHSDALRTNYIKQLRASPIDSNYLDLSFVVKLHLQACRAGHVLEDVHPRDLTPKWRNENIAVGLVITKTIYSSNHWHVKNHCTDTRTMWLFLKTAHQDFSAGGWMYWLRKLFFIPCDLWWCWQTLQCNHDHLW